MVRTIIIALCCLFIWTEGFAQAGDFRFGFQASPTFSSMGTNRKAINGNGTNLGLQLGVLAEYSFAEQYSLISGLQLGFNQGGTLQHAPGDSLLIDVWTNSPDLSADSRCVPNRSNFKYALQYVQIPLALRLRTKQFGYLRYYAEVPSFMIGFNVRARGDVEGAVNVEDEYINKDVNPLNIWWGLGGGVEYAISESTSLVGGIHYHSSLIDVTKDKGAAYYAPDGSSSNLCEGRFLVEEENSNARVNILTLRLGVMF